MTRDSRAASAGIEGKGQLDGRVLPASQIRIAKHFVTMLLTVLWL
jgi:hypothetical protein